MKLFRFIGAVLLVVVLFSSCTAKIDNVDSKPYIISDISLKTGRYYQNGDISMPYVEVFDDKTLQWRGADFEEMVRDAQNGENPDKEAFEQAIAAEADRLSAVHSYTIVEFVNIDTTMIAWDWVEESGAVQGFIYIDENTFKFNDNEIFIYIE